MKRCLLSLFSSLVVGMIFPQTKALEDSIFSLMRKYDAIGVSVAVVKDTSIVYIHSFGLKDKEDSIPLQNNDFFRIASVSKTIVATAIMQLVEKKQIGLDDDINRYLDFMVVHPHYPSVPITIKMLMCHRSSINDSEGRDTFDRINPEKNSNYAKCYCDYAPGDGYTYSNMNYNLLGAIIEKVSNERFDIYINEHVMRPLGLHGSFNRLEFDSSRFVKPYRYRRGMDSFSYVKNIYQPTSLNTLSYRMGYSTTLFSPPGGMIISAEELARYMMMHMYDGRLGKTQILTQESEIIMRQVLVAENRYGLSLQHFSNVIPEEELIGQMGGAHGVHTAMLFQSEKKYGFVVFCNGCKAKSIDGHEMNWDIMRVLYKELKLSN